MMSDRIKNKELILKIIIFISVVGGVLLSFASAYAASDKIIAVVNDNVITQSEVDTKFIMIQQHLERTATSVPNKVSLKQKILDDLISKELQLQIGKRNNMQVSDKELNAAIANIAERNRISLTQLQQELQKQGMKYEDFRSQIRDDILISRIQHQAVGQNIVVSEAEVDRYLRTAKKGGDSVGVNDTKLYHVLDILVPINSNVKGKDSEEAKKLAANMLEQLRKGATVDQVVKDVKFKERPIESTDLGWRKKSELPDIFATTVANLSPRDAAGPITAPNGLHIIILVNTQESKSGQDVDPSKLSRDEVREIVYRDKLEQALQPWLEQLRATAYIKFFADNGGEINAK